MKRRTSKKTSFSGKIRRHRLPLALLVALFGFCSDIGVRLGIWSSNNNGVSESGLLPYEKPNFRAFSDIFISDAFAS
ncbi:MAG: hypothetical protein SFX19_09275 [Alphaproteobacteria bacterium]|nr:hypothetical protein [Alphaproteobacteria bacterium]